MHSHTHDTVYKHFLAACTESTGGHEQLPVAGFGVPHVWVTPGAGSNSWYLRITVWVVHARPHTRQTILMQDHKTNK